MFPVAILVATTAMASGVGGATFFAPIFILGLRLSPEVAIGTGLITEVFGFANGVGAYARKRLIDYRLGRALLVVTIPAAVVGSWLAGVLDSGFLKVILGTGLFAVALSFLRTRKGRMSIGPTRRSTRSTGRRLRRVWSPPTGKRSATPCAIEPKAESSPESAGCLLA